MRLRGRDLEDSTVSWIPSVLGVQSVRLRLRLDRRDDRGRGLWQLVDLGEEVQSGRRIRDRTPPTCSQSLMSIPAAASVQSGGGEMQSPGALSPSFLPPPSGKVPGRKRGRPPLKRHPEYQSRYPESFPPIKVPKKRGRKPGFKLKSRLMTPLAISPPSSTPEPDMSSIPQDAATVPHSATPQVLTVCIYVNKHVNTGPNLDRKKVLQLPDHLGPARPSVVLQQAVQGCIDSAFQQKAVFTLLTEGYGGEKISATFDGKQHLLSLPVVNSVGYVLRFLKKLCRSLLCEKLFSDQPIAPSSSPSSSSSFHTEKHSDGQHKSTDSMVDDYHGDSINPKRYSADLSDSAYGAMSSLYTASKPAYGFRSGTSYSGGVCRQAASPSTFTEVNRSAYSPSPEGGEAKPPSSKDPSRWSVDEVVWFIKDADPQALGPHVDLFRKHEIDGDALLLLKSDMIMKYLGLKLGPALKLCYHIDKLKQNKF
ncbi:sex comb on midleg-like protein 4 isoform X1 [Carassius carassius]|uniref:sex comb on midleg-like protein 4 isoform X1 n=2 Tax=Carassius carassius TaxID=217509 RepID=UPI002868FEA7|nr:sex comb on midleg-like protein 4 isoform X1 [Carassius carassius]